MSITYKNENIPQSRRCLKEFEDSQPVRQAALNVDLRQYDLGVETQGGVGSCVGNAIASAYEVMTNIRSPQSAVNLSRLFLYYNARVLEDSDSEDIGASIRSGLRAAHYFGLCLEEVWPYVESNTNVKPPPPAYCDAAYKTISSFKRVRGSEGLITNLNQQKPVIIGIDLYENFNRITQENPIYTDPSPNDRYLGSHAMLIMGYSLMPLMYLAKNSFGSEWGSNGYCYLTPNMLYNEYIFEMWTMDL